jgi:hypothetical protein
LAELTGKRGLNTFFDSFAIENPGQKQPDQDDENDKAAGKPRDYASFRHLHAQTFEQTFRRWIVLFVSLKALEP